MPAWPTSPPSSFTIPHFRSPRISPTSFTFQQTTPTRTNMQFSTLVVLLGATLAAASPNPNNVLHPRATQPLCSSVNSCVTTNGNLASATAFCASYNSISTVTSGTTTSTVEPTDCAQMTKRAVPQPQVLAPSKARCFKVRSDGHKAASRPRHRLR
jgi:hypothetical protein